MKIINCLAYCLFLIFSCELLFQLTSYISPQWELKLTNRVGENAFLNQDGEEPVLNPRYMDHDSRGFRNKEALETADLVILGDSMVYGITAPRSYAWPQQLANQINGSVYNMGIPATGPGHYYGLVEQALALKPKHIITSIYLGNDLWGSFRACYLLEYEGLGCAKVDPKIRKEAKIVESIFHKASEQEAHLVDPRNVLNSSDGTAAFTHEGLGGITINWLRDNSKLWGALRLIKTGITSTRNFDLKTQGNRPNEGYWNYLEKQAALDPTVLLYKNKHNRTVLRPSYRALGLNTELYPVLQLGLEITSNIAQRMDQRIRTAGVNHTVLIHPTKEFIYWPFIDKTLRTPDYAKLVSLEEKSITKLEQDFANHGIQTINITPALRDAIKSGAGLYPESAQSHPNSIGYGSIAQTVRMKLL